MCRSDCSNGVLQLNENGSGSLSPLCVSVAALLSEPIALLSTYHGEHGMRRVI
jgi:hypothetical protein